jgi:hypothetical protein
MLGSEEQETDMFEHPDNTRALVDMRMAASRQAAADRRLAVLARPCGRKVRRSRRFFANWASRPRRAPSAKPTVA